LRRLQNTPGVIRLFDCEESGGELRLVMEAGKDFGSVLRAAKAQVESPGLDALAVRFYWRQMLRSVAAIHDMGVIHSDLKPGNFVLVEEHLKLIDFGISTSVGQDVTSVLKDSQAGTFNYMAPETVRQDHLAGGQYCVKVGKKSDVWSLGCLLYHMVYRRTPLQHITRTLQKIQALADPNTVIRFEACGDENLLDTLRSCLRHRPEDRPTIEALLRHPYVTKQ